MIGTLQMAQLSLVNSLSKPLQKAGMNPLYDRIFVTGKIAETTSGDCTSQSSYQPKLGMGLLYLTNPKAGLMHSTYSGTLGVAALDTGDNPKMVLIRESSLWK